jgi:regulator of nucleoside diphosphate kinase
LYLRTPCAAEFDMQKKRHRLPSIAIASDDHERLTELALASLGKGPGAALLLRELSRAKVTPAVPDNVVGMRSHVTFEYDGARYADVTLVYPTDADFAKGRISVLTPVGAMLLGLAKGQRIAWRDEDGRARSIEVGDVSGPERFSPAL